MKRPDHNSSVAAHCNWYLQESVSVDGEADRGEILKAYYSGAHTMLWLVENHCDHDPALYEALKLLIDEMNQFAMTEGCATDIAH